MEDEGDVVSCCVFSPTLKTLERINLPGVNLFQTVNHLKSEVAKQTDIPIQDFVVIYHGKCLNEADSLESNGVKHGMTLHILPKPPIREAIVSPNVERGEVGLEHLALALKASMRSASFRNTFQMFTKQNVFENIIASSPGLSDDPVAIACLLDTDLLGQFTDVATLQRAVDSHPALVEAISHIVANILDSSSQAGPSGFGESSVPLAYSYLLEPSDDEDVDSSSQADLANSSGTSQTPSMETASSAPFSAITPAQLASALAAVVTSPPLNQMATTSSAFSPSVTSSPMVASTTAAESSAGTSAAGQIITSELLSQAIQQAISVSTQSQIQQLRDMGITNDSLSLRALQITGGDVQATLELIFDLQQNENQRQ